MQFPTGNIGQSDPAAEGRHLPLDLQIAGHSLGCRFVRIRPYPPFSIVDQLQLTNCNVVDLSYVKPKVWFQ